MATRKQRKRKPPKSSLSLGMRVSLAVLAIIAGCGIFGLKWSQSMKGQLWLSERGVASAQQRVQRHLHEGIHEALLDAGVPADSIAVETPTVGGVIRFEVGSSIELLDLNIAVTAAVNHRGGQVLRGERWDQEQGSVLELTIGAPRWPSHRLVAKRGPRAQELVPPPPPKGQLAIVIDDWGHNMNSAARRILDLESAVTLAILPERPRSRKILNEASRAGKQTILHMPMQPMDGTGPGPGPLALTVGMDPMEIRELLTRCLDGLPGVAGVNNHMGSEFTQHRAELEVVMEVMAERGLIFLDSLTSAKSVAYDVARDREIPSLRNDLFLDLDIEDPSIIEQRLWRLVERARRRGFAVGIGHVTDGTAEALERVLPQLDEADVKPVFLSDLLVEFAPG